MDDNSNSFASSVALRGLTSIAPGLSVIFLEGNTTGTTDATLNASFITAWFGGSAPAGFTLANYGGSGVSLGSGGDAVNIYGQQRCVAGRSHLRGRPPQGSPSITAPVPAARFRS
ncbi:MAG: hypothetical protein WDN00_14180 [Limisphaerales bacterium]